MAKKKPGAKHPGAVALAKRRAASLTPQERSTIARKAANARWAKRRGKDG